MSTDAFHIGKEFRTRTSEKSRVRVEAKWEGARLSFTGEVIAYWHRQPYAVGQVVDDVREINPRLADLWDRWHLNDMRAGCTHQESRYRAEPCLRPTWANDYKGSTGETLGSKCPECGHGYSTVWQTEPVPDEVLTEIVAILRGSL